MGAKRHTTRTTRNYAYASRLHTRTKQSTTGHHNRHSHGRVRQPQGKATQQRPLHRNHAPETNLPDNLIRHNCQRVHTSNLARHRDSKEKHFGEEAHCSDGTQATFHQDPSSAKAKRAEMTTTTMLLQGARMETEQAAAQVASPTIVK